MQQKQKTASNRRLKVSEQLRREIAVIFQESNFRNQALYETIIMVTEVDVSPDFQNAKVYVVPIGEAPKKEILDHLKAEAPHIRHLISQRISLRVTPSFRFHLDETFDQAAHLESLLLDPHVKQDL